MIQDLISGYKIARELRKIDEEEDYLDKCSPIDELFRDLWIIPKDKIKGLRFGQLLVNALTEYMKKGARKDFETYLFYLSNDALEDLIIKYLEEK